MKTQNDTQRGFTLLELMIAIAIIIILTSVSLGAYKSHVQRAKFTEVINAIAPLRTVIATCYVRVSVLSRCDDSIVENGSTENVDITAARDQAKTAEYIGDIEINYISKDSIDIKLTSSFELENSTYVLNGVATGNTISWHIDRENSTCLETTLCR